MAYTRRASDNVLTLRSNRTNPYFCVKVPSKCIVPFFNEYCASDKPNTIKEVDESLKVGNLYSLQGDECDGFAMPKRVYEVIANVENDGHKSVVMKFVDGEPTTVFSLTRNNCRTLNIPYQDGLQIFPTDLGWKAETIEVETKKEEGFNPEDLSTYPCDYETKCIRRVCCKLYGFQWQNELRAITFDGNLIPYNDLVMQVMFKYPNMTPRYMNFRNITERITNGAYRIVDNNSKSMYIELEMDNLGIDIRPENLKGLDLSKCLDILLYVDDEQNYR